MGDLSAAGGVPAALFPDKNVLIDAAELLAHAWGECAGLAPVDPGIMLPLLSGSVSTAAAGLDLLQRPDLAAAVRTGRVPLPMLRARAEGLSLAGMLADGPPEWLFSFIARSGDRRIQDLAEHAVPAQNGQPRMVVTTDVLLESQMILSNKGFDVADATLLVQLLVADAEVIECPFGLRKAVQRGELAGLADRVREAAPDHLAAIDWEDPYWRVKRADVAHLAEPPSGKSWRRHKQDAFELYGVDGEDLFLMWQVEYCAQVLGRPVDLATSDRHCAFAALRAGVSSPVLYAVQGGRYVSERIGAVPADGAVSRMLSVPAGPALAPSGPRARVAGSWR